MTTLEKLRCVFEREFKMPLPYFSLGTSPQDLREWNSVAHISLILETEKAFGIRFTTEDLGALEDVGAIHRTVEAKLSATVAPTGATAAGA